MGRYRIYVTQGLEAGAGPERDGPYVSSYCHHEMHTVNETLTADDNFYQMSGLIQMK